MVALLFALGALVAALIIGVGRQVAVFTVFQPGLWLFRRYRRKRLVGLGLVVLLSVAALLTGPSGGVLALVGAAGAFSTLALLFNLDRLFPALRAVQAVPADVSAATNGTVGSGAHVLVVELGGQRRAYPLERMVIPRHLIHDVVGGVPIVVTYCAICRTGLVFHAGRDGQRLFFEVAGVFRRNLLMEDSQTHTLWQQATGQAVYGPLSGTALEMLPAMQMSWDRARQQQGMTLATEPVDAPFAVLATRPGFRLLNQVTERVTPPGHTHLSKALPRRETVFGIQINGEAKAYPLSDVRSLGIFSDIVGGVGLELAFDGPTEVLRVRRRDGEPDPIVQKSWWLGWNEFHPLTKVYRS